MVGVAVLVTPDAAKNVLQDVRIGLGAVALMPISDKTASVCVWRTTDPFCARTDQRSSAENRRWIVEALTRLSTKLAGGNRQRR